MHNIHICPIYEYSSQAFSGTVYSFHDIQYFSWVIFICSFIRNQKTNIALEIYNNGRYSKILNAIFIWANNALLYKNNETKETFSTSFNNCKPIGELFYRRSNLQTWLYNECLLDVIINASLALTWLDDDDNMCIKIGKILNGYMARYFHIIYYTYNKVYISKKLH